MHQEATQIYLSLNSSKGNEEGGQNCVRKFLKAVIEWILTMADFSEAMLAGLIKQELDALAAMATASVQGNVSPWSVTIPDIDVVDHPLVELANLVARTSNNYARLARLSGMAKAWSKICEGRFERKFKSSRTGKNDAERQANGFVAANAEHSDMVAAQALYAIADSLENAARIASESSRKIFDKINNSFEGEKRAGGFAADNSQYASIDSW